MTPTGFRPREGGQLSLEGPNILELSTAGQAGIQMSEEIVQPSRRNPAIDVRFQILKGKVSDGLSNTADLSGLLGLQLCIRF